MNDINIQLLNGGMKIYYAFLKFLNFNIDNEHLIIGVLANLQNL